MKNKRAENLMESVIFFIIIAVFFAFMFAFIVRAGNKAVIVEQVYSKQIALIIDNSKPGTTIDLDVSKLYTVSEKNKYLGDLVRIDNDEREVRINLVKGRGYSYKFFNDADIIWSLNKEKEVLHLEIK